MSKRDLRYRIFRNMKGCSNRDCLISKNEGLCTNSTCSCLRDMTRSQLNIVSERLKSVIQIENNQVAKIRDYVNNYAPISRQSEGYRVARDILNFIDQL